MSKVAAPKVVLADASEVAEATITVENGRIVSITEGIAPEAEVVDGWLVPGYVDTHSHGAAGAAFAHPDAEQVRAAARHHLRHGSTTLFASTVTESLDDLVDQVERLRHHIADGTLDGIHLEGPFLAPSHKGAHNADLLAHPAPEFVERLIEVGGDDLRMITLAPELDHGLDAVSRFAEAGVMPAFGHTAAGHEVAAEAIERGARVVTHLFNAMCGIHHRNPGPIPHLLTDDRVVLELICDGVHVHPEVVRMVVESAGVRRVALVTDAMEATGVGDGDYGLGTLRVQVRDGVARIATDDDSPGPIAGSTLTMDRAFAFVVQQVGCSIADAATMASVVPARAHGLTDVGQIAEGRRADFCVVDDRGVLQRVMKAGEWIEGVGA